MSGWTPFPRHEIRIPDIEHTRVDDKGNPGPMTWKSEAKWDLSGELPALRVTLSVPPNLIPQKMDRILGGEPYELLEKQGFQFDFLGPLETRRFVYGDAKGSAQDYEGVISSVTFQETGFFLHSSCVSNGLRIVPGKGRSKFLFVGVRCEARAKSWHITIYTSREAKWVGASVPRVPSELIELDIPRTPNSVSDSVLRLGYFELAREDNPGESTRFEIHKARPPTVLQKTSGFSMNLGVGFTYANYHEALTDGTRETRESQLGITPKVAAVYQVNSNWDLGVSAFLTLLPLMSTSTPEDLDSVRYFGFNMRVGRNLGLDLLGGQWKILVGSYFWGMLTSSDYGVVFLTGPQAVLSYSKETATRKQFSAYLKFAPTSESLSSLSLANRELAIGVGYRLSAPGAKNRWDLSFDFSDTKLTGVEVPHVLQLNTYTLGVAVWF